MLFHILAKLSEKFGSVLKMPPLYKLYYLAEGLAAVAALTHLIQASWTLTASNDFLQTTGVAVSLFLYHLPLTVALTIGLVVTWKYWSWLITERK